MGVEKNGSKHCLFRDSEIRQELMTMVRSDKALPHATSDFALPLFLLLLYSPGCKMEASLRPQPGFGVSLNDYRSFETVSCHTWFHSATFVIVINFPRLRNGRIIAATNRDRSLIKWLSLFWNICTHQPLPVSSSKLDIPPQQHISPTSP